MPIKDYSNIIGKELGNLKIVSVSDNVVKGKRRECEVLCLSCNKTKTLKLHKVLEGNYKSCGCKSNKRTSMKKTDYNSFIGSTLNNFVVHSHDKSNRTLTIECLSCGDIKSVDRYKFTHNKLGKCRCQLHHNMSRSSVYSRWKGMKGRCNNPNNKNYHHYGGRGIKVCDEWENSFENFYKDMGEPPTDKHQLDRIDNNGNYEPNNCRWVLPLQNVNNQRDKKNKTGYQNVYLRGDRYESSFEFNKKYYYVGSFDNPKDAYDKCLEMKNKVKEEFNW